jgi:hypothetical protein
VVSRDEHIEELVGGGERAERREEYILEKLILLELCVTRVNYVGTQQR